MDMQSGIRVHRASYKYSSRDLVTVWRLGHAFQLINKKMEKENRVGVACQVDSL